MSSSLEVAAWWEEFRKKYMEISDDEVESFTRQVPYLLHTFFKKLQKNGFTEPQAFELTKEYLVAVIANQ